MSDTQQRLASAETRCTARFIALVLQVVYITETSSTLNGSLCFLILTSSTQSQSSELLRCQFHQRLHADQFYCYHGCPDFLLTNQGEVFHLPVFFVWMIFLCSGSETRQGDLLVSHSRRQQNSSPDSRLARTNRITFCPHEGKYVVRGIQKDESYLSERSKSTEPRTRRGGIPRYTRDRRFLRTITIPMTFD